MKSRDGFRQELYTRCYGDRENGTTPKREFARSFADWLEKNGSSHGVKPKGAPHLQTLFSRFFEYKRNGDLDLSLTSALLDFLEVSNDDIRSWLRTAPPFDLWREAWLGEEDTPTAVDLGRFGMRLHRLQPSAATRSLNAYRRTFDAGSTTWSEADMYTSPSSGCTYVVRGSVKAHFLDCDAIKMSEGDALLYNSRHPHRLVPLDADSVLLDVSSNLRGGVPSELFMQKWDVKTPGVAPGDPGMESVRQLVAFAIHSTHMKTSSLGKRTTIKEKRFKKIANMEVTPTLSEVREIAHLCRLPEEKLFTPISHYREEDVFKYYSELIGGPVDSLTNLVLEHHKAYTTRVEPNSASETQWEMRNLGSPPTLAHRVSDGLEAGLFIVRGPDDAQEYAPESHHDSSPAEEFIYVLDGRLGVRLRLDLGPVCEGILEPGDAIWFSTVIKHSFFAPDGRPSRSLHFRQALPARRG